ncbi:MAG TPA: hypothetical protein VHU86_03760 [Solirubrobacterales bacterium]|jgi:hypothetical protein|nr:hypothetical protein [Solirubrobacterales bacterium]
MGGVRYANIGLGVGMTILVIGAILLKDSGEGALQALGLASFFLGFVVYHGLDERNKRRQGRDQ